MSLMRMALTEVRKTVTLPGTVSGIAVAFLGSLGITVLNVFAIRDDIANGRVDDPAGLSPVEAVFSAVPFGTVGAIVIGVLVISSEYTANSPAVGGGRQIVTTFTAQPRRVRVLLAKALSTILLVTATALAVVPSCLIAAHLAGGESGMGDVHPGLLIRIGGVALYWTLTALLALAITVCARSGIVALVLLIANSSVVSVSFLLTKITSWAYFLPDVAGIRLFSSSDAWGMYGGALDPLVGSLVMAAWVLGSLVIASIVFVRRDA